MVEDGVSQTSRENGNFTQKLKYSRLYLSCVSLVAVWCRAKLLKHFKAQSHISEASVEDLIEDVRISELPVKYLAASRFSVFLRF